MAPTSAATSVTSRPVMNRARLWACVRCLPSPTTGHPSPGRIATEARRPIWIALVGLPTLDVLDLNESDLPQLTVGDHGFRLPDQRVPRVVVSEAEDETGLLHPLDQIECLLQRVRDRLVTDDVEAAVEAAAAYS